MDKLAIIAFWNISEQDNKFYIASTHYSYLEYACSKFSKVYLVSSSLVKENISGLSELSSFNNLEVVKLPFIAHYADAYRYFFRIINVFKKIAKKTDIIYCRVPDPFCWFPAFIAKRKTIMHYVGDTIDATWHNQQWNVFHKTVLLLGYLPEYILTLIASARCTVYTNGKHLQNKLLKYKIKAQPVISSTIGIAELKEPKPFLRSVPPKMIYVGYLRFAKGMNLFKRLWLKLKLIYPNFKFDVVGTGEMAQDITDFVKANSLEENVILHGHIDCKSTLKQMLRDSDLFIFPSLSEGSPRVVIEAMAEGLPVLSTPVGSLPDTFIDGKTIRYFNFDREDEVLRLINEYLTDSKPFEIMRNCAFEIVKRSYTKEKFLSQIYSLEK